MNFYVFSTLNTRTPIHNKVFYCAINNMRFYVIDNELRYEEVPELYGSHLEADTRMMFHATHSDNQDPGNIIVRANAADVLIILLANIHHLQNSQLWYDAGNNYDNSREYVDVNLLAEKINFRTALPGAYGLLVNDYTPAGKVKPLELVIKNQKFIDALASLGEDELTEGVTAVIEECVCWIYGYKHQFNIDEKFAILCSRQKVNRELI